MNEPTLTVIGNLTADPELRYTQGGQPVVNFTIAATPRSFDRASNEWKDGQTAFIRCTQWGEPAENTAASLFKGNRVIAFGRLIARSWTGRDGTQHDSLELSVEEVGPSLRYATATVVRSESSSRRDASAPVARPSAPTAPSRSQERWVTPQADSSWAADYDEETPF